MINGVRDATRTRVSLAPKEIEILLAIDLAGGRIRLNELAEKTSLSESRISRVMDALTRQGYVIRVRNPKDLRATFAIMTDHGRRSSAVASEHFITALRNHFLDVIPAKSLASFGQTLEALARAPREGKRATASDTRADLQKPRRRRIGPD